MKNIKKEVADLKAQLKEINAMRYDNPKRKIADATFWTMVNDLSSKAGDDMVGTHIKFNVADGYAHYLVVKTGKQFCTVEHLDVGDGYAFAGVYDGKIQRGIVEQQIGFWRVMDKIWPSK